MAMKRVVVEEPGTGIESFLGQPVTVFAERYIYGGVLSGVSETSLFLTDAVIVYETGELDAEEYADAQTVGGGEWYVERGKVESFGKGKGKGKK